MMIDYQNPIIKGFYPDPSICKAEGKYYLVTSSFEYFPGVPIFESDDLVNWNQIGHCLSRKSQLNLSGSQKSKGIYAPTIRYNEGVFYVITTNVTTGENFLVTTDNPKNGWSEPVIIKGWSGIDPSLYFENGRIFLQGNSYKSNEPLGIYQCELDPINFSAITERVMICKGIGGKAPEAPHVFKRGQYYYLVAAEGGTEYGHMVTIFRSEDIYGPYLSAPNNPILTNRSIKSELQCVGHADFIEDYNDNWWLVCLGVRSKGSHAYYHHLGRETMLAPVIWNSDGWPVVNTNGQLDVNMKGPLTANQSKENHDFDLEFNLEQNEIIYLRNPNMDKYILKDQSLVLEGSKATLNDTEEVSFLGIRQRDFDIKFEADFIVTDNDAEEYGVTTYMSPDFHYDVKINSNKKNISLVKQIGSICHVEKEIIFNTCDKIKLSIDADEKYYTFYAEFDGRKELLGRGECSFLASELSATFTGVILGVFSYSQNNKSVTLNGLSYKEI